jgi:hypothetical protein
VLVTSPTPYNRVHHNVKRGIRLEISDNAKIFGNVVWENGQDIPGGNAGISITASRDVGVYDNILAWNKVRISVVNSLREANAGALSSSLTPSRTYWSTTTRFWPRTYLRQEMTHFPPWPGERLILRATSTTRRPITVVSTTATCI